MRKYNKYIILVLANLIAAINFNLLTKPINLVSGGSPGLSLVINKIFNIGTSHVITIIYIITFILAIFLLDKKSIIGIIIASIVYPLFTYLTEDITLLIKFSYKDILLITIIAAIISGISNGLIYKYGFAGSGMSIISRILSEYLKISISVVNFIINMIIVLMGAYFFGFNVILYAIIYLYISNYICNIVILGVSSNKVIFIKSDKNKEIIKLLKDKYFIDVTIINDMKDFSILAVVSNRIYNRVKNDLLNIDNKIFFTADNCYEVGK